MLATIRTVHCIYNFNHSLSTRFGIIQGLVTASILFGKDGLAEVYHDLKNQFTVWQDEDTRLSSYQVIKSQISIIITRDEVVDTKHDYTK